MQIDFLNNQSQFLEEVAQCCLAYWPAYYNGELAQSIDDQKRHLAMDRLPLTLVAFNNECLLGTIALLEQDMEIRENYSPWIGSFYVVPLARGLYEGTAVGLELYKAAIQVAKDLHIDTLYSWTRSLGRSLQRHGWTCVERVEYQGHLVGIFRLKVQAKQAAVITQ